MAWEQGPALPCSCSHGCHQGPHTSLVFVSPQGPGKGQHPGPPPAGLTRAPAPPSLTGQVTPSPDSSHLRVTRKLSCGTVESSSHRGWGTGLGWV